MCLHEALKVRCLAYCCISLLHGIACSHRLYRRQKYADIASQAKQRQLHFAMSEDGVQEGRRRAAERSQGLECDIAPLDEAEWARHTLQTTVEVQEGMFGRLEWRELVCKPASQLPAVPIMLAVNLLCICVLAAGQRSHWQKHTPVVAVGETQTVRW